MPFFFWHVTTAVLQVTLLFWAGHFHRRRPGVTVALPLSRANGTRGAPLWTLTYTHKANTMTLKINVGAQTTLPQSPTQFAGEEREGYGAASLIQAAVRLTQSWWM